MPVCALLLQVESKALSPHTAGEPPHPRAAAVARELGLRLAPDKTAVPFDECVDIVNFDLVVVMDRFDSEALLREVAVFDALNPGGCYCARVRRLGEWAPLRSADARSLRGDIPDPLYGNLGGEAETAAIWAAVRHIRAGCRGLLREMTQLAANAGVLCDDEDEGAADDTQASSAGDTHELHACAAPPTGGAAAALAAAVESSLDCPLWIDEPLDEVADDDAPFEPPRRLSPARIFTGVLGAASDGNRPAARVRAL